MKKVNLLGPVPRGAVGRRRARSRRPIPTKTIRLVVPFSPGGAADLTARTLGQKMSEQLGQPIVVENKPGANGVVGIECGGEVGA